MIIALFTLIAIPFFTYIEGMIPKDNLPPDSFIPKAECPLSQKMQRTIESLPENTKKIAINLFEKALTRQEPLNPQLLNLMSLYGNVVLLDASNGSTDYGSIRFTRALACSVELNFKASLAVANLFRYGAPKCYVTPAALTQESKIIKKQITHIQCFTYPIEEPQPTNVIRYIHKMYNECHKQKLRNILPQTLLAFIDDTKIRPLHRLAMLTYDILYTEFLSKPVNDTGDMYADFSNEMLSLSVVQQYTWSRNFDHITNTGRCITKSKYSHKELVATQIKTLAPNLCYTDALALKYADQFIENIKTMVTKSIEKLS